MSLTSCLKEATALSPNLRNAVMKRAGELRKDGKSGPEAALQAATEIRDRVAAELAAAEEADQLLQAQTEEELRAKTEREQAALDGERRQREAEQARLRKEAEDRDIRARADATVDDFQLGQSAQQQMSGMGDLFSGDPGTMFDGQATEADTPAEPPAPSLRERAGAMKDAAAERKALDDLNDALGDLGDILGKNVRKNLTPEQEQKLLPVLTRVMDAAFRAGYYSFRQAARFVLDKIRGALGDDAADAITLDHLQGAYIGMAGRYRDDPAFADRRPDAKRAVVEIESKEELENGDAPTTGDDVERGGQPGLAAGDQDVRGPVPAAAGEAGRGAGQPGATPGAQRAGSGRGARVADGDAAADGERGDQPRRGGRAAGAPGPAGDRERERSSRAGDPRVQPAAAAGEETAAADSHAAAVARRVAAQKLAGAKPVTFADKASIDETLPLLLPEQRDDVLKAETRFAAGHAGILFTNGTGTGKTFTGLGIVKRMHQAGKRNILILAPSDKIINDWVRSAKMLGLDIGQLESTKDAGKGLVITTYANAGANLTLADRDWDAVVADESHYLSSNKDGDLTAAAATLRAITLHPDGAYTRAAMIHRELDAKITQLNEAAKSNRTSDDERLWAKAAQQEAEASRLMRDFEAKRDEIKADIKARQATRTKVVFLSATPFAWVQNLNYAQGYLFDWHEGKGQDLASGSGWGHSYNSGDHREQFYMQHFGYRMRYNKLTRPEAGVDVALMERQFNTYLKRTGALTGRQLEVGPDYDRRFIAVESGLGRRIDEALGWERDDGFDYTTATKEQTDARNADQELRTRLNKAFAFQQRQYFLEAIKARALVPYIQAQLDAGRKVVVFHDFKKGGVRENPFSARVVLDGVDKEGPQASAYERWAARFPDLANLDVAGLGSPIETLGAAFEGRIDLFNGDIKAKDGEANVARFNDDASGPRVLLVQSAKAEGWSGHDTTGKHQRVQLNLGMPTRPFTAIQQEGRIYRTGQASDAMQRYASTGTSWERTAFAQKLAERAETTENLAMGEAARALKQSFIDAYENADDYPPGHEGEGKGGKEADRASNNVVSAFDLAKTAYWAQQKRTQRNKSREGTDYFATPEPIGLKLVEWLDLRAGETGMEPSAGHGAIARWFPEHIPTVAVEPSDELRSRLALVFNGNHARLRDGTFEQLDVGANKADGIAMNPPFGVGGSMAIPHLAKAVKHLRDGGRVAAIVPRGGMADKRLDAFLESEEGQGLRWVADITLPGITFNRAGAGVVARVVVFDKGVDPEGQAVTRDLRSIEDITELFDRLENVELPRRGKPVPTAEELIAATRTADAPPTREERQAIREVQKAEKEQRKGSGASLAEQLGLQLVDYTTSKGKLIKGVLRSDLTRDQVQQFSSAPFWMRDRRAWFIRDHELAKAHELFPFPTPGASDVRFSLTPEPTEPVYSELFRQVDDVDQADGPPDTAAYGRASPDDAAALRRAQRSINRARPDLVLDAVPARAGAAVGQPLRGADRARVASAELARRLFGKRVVFFRSNTPFANGFYASGDDTRIFLNADSRAPHMAVLGHELLHAMRKDRPDLYDALKARVMAVARDTDQRDLLLQLQRLKAGLPKIEQDVLDEEFIADVVGDRFMEPEFWRAMAKDQPGAFQRVVQAVRRFLDDVLQALTQRRPFNTTAYLADVQAARDAVADAMRNYSGGEVGSMAAEPDQEIRFSLDDGSPQRQALGDFLAAVRTGSKSRFNALHRTISTQLHKAAVDADFARAFGIAQDYEQDVARAASRPAQQAPDLLPAFDNARAALRRLLRGDREKALNDKVARALFAGTLENGPEPHTGVIWSDAALRDRFGLDDRGISLYRQARKAIDASLDETASALAYQMVKKHAPQLRQAVRRVPGRARALIEASLGPLAADPEIGAALDDALAVFDRAAELKAGGYAPLMRFGRYAVDVVGEDGERLHFERFDTELQAKMAAQRLAREYPGASVERSTMSEEAYKLFAGVDPETVALFSQQLGNRIDGTALQEWYRKAVSDRSAMKRMIGPRKGMAGYSPDLQRVLASFITSNARLSARQMNMGDMASTIADMQERRVAGDVVDEAMRLRDYLDNPDEPFKGLRSLMFTWYLGGSVASAAVNMTQPVMMTLPYLSQFGNASKYLSGAVKEAMSGKVANEKLRNAMQRAAEDGKVDPQEVHHLYHEGMSTLVDRLPGGNDLKARAQGFATLWGWFFGAAENFNRRITFIAAYRMAQADETLGDPYAFAIRAIDETQGIYNKSNRPNWARGTGSFGALGVAAFTFKQYSIAYVELLVRMAKSGPRGRWAALGMVGMLILASGVQGFPGMEDYEDFIDTLAQMMGYRGNTKAAMREALVDMFGSSIADAVMYGASSGLPLDFSSRLGLGNLLPATGLLKKSNEHQRGREVAEILGPMGGFASQVADFTDVMDSGGGIGKAMASFAPLAVKNALKGMNMADVGYYTDMAGKRVTDTTDFDAALKFIGFQPTRVAEKRRPERIVMQDINLVKSVESDIVRLRAEAIVEKDPDKRAKAFEMLRDWNKENPELRIAIKDSQVVKRVKEMRRTSGQRILSTAPRETRRALAEALEP